MQKRMRDEIDSKLVEDSATIFGRQYKKEYGLPKKEECLVTNFI